MASTISAGTTSGTAIAIAGDTTGNLAFTTQAGTYTQTMPNGTGNIVVNGVNSPLVSGTAVASTSGTSIDFTSIPSWVKRVTVLFSGVSLSGSSSALIQLGTSGGVDATSYVSTSVTTDSSGGSAGISSTTGFPMFIGSGAYLVNASISIGNISGNTWVSSHLGNLSTTNIVAGAGTKTLSGTLDRVRITTVNGTDTFDAGSINIQYE